MARKEDSHYGDPTFWGKKKKKKRKKEKKKMLNVIPNGVSYLMLECYDLIPLFRNHVKPL